MNICFVLPKFSRRINGGFKIIFEYANRLSERGHNVKILFLNETSFLKYKIPRFVKKRAANYLTQKEPMWFNLNSQIDKVSGYDKRKMECLNETYIYIATSISTVDYVKNINAKKAYFIQGYENWDKSDEYVCSSYQLGMKNIVISNWLEEIVNKYSKIPCEVIKNPIDTSIYRDKTPLSDRNKYSLAFLYHEQEQKGSKYVMEAISKLKLLYPDLLVYSFGTSKQPEEFPDYYNYYYCASQDETVNIYNKVKVFMCGTIDEGYGLTGLEAMACGTVLVSTAYRGVYEYAIDKKNALLSPIRDVDALVDNVIKIFDDENLANYLSKNGIDSVSSGFSWDNAVDKFEEVLKSI